MVIVRLLLFLALSAIGIALVLYFVKRDPRYLRFVGQVFKFTLILLAIVLLTFAAQRLMQEPAERKSGAAPAVAHALACGSVPSAREESA